MLRSSKTDSNASVSKIKNKSEEVNGHRYLIKTETSEGQDNQSATVNSGKTANNQTALEQESIKKPKQQNKHRLLLISVLVLSLTGLMGIYYLFYPASMQANLTQITQFAAGLVKPFDEEFRANVSYWLEQTYVAQIEPIAVAVAGSFDNETQPNNRNGQETAEKQSGSRLQQLFGAPEEESPQITSNNPPANTLSLIDVGESADVSSNIASSDEDDVRGDPLEDFFRTAQQAFEDEDWSTAIDTYEKIRLADDTYETDIITQNLAIAYLNVAINFVENAQNEETNLDLAFSYFRNVLLLDPENSTAREHAELLGAYLAGESAFQARLPHEAVKHLLPLYRVQPNYLDGKAAQLLNDAYVEMGDRAVRRGENQAAMELFRQALAINGIDNNDVADRMNSLESLLRLTPLPYPANLPTVQAAAKARNLPPVIVSTPTPASTADAIGQAEYATAVAVTTGTFTPPPQLYVTPILIKPSPPPLNIATEAARAVEATAQAELDAVTTPTPLPYNAVIGEYVYTTPKPDNAVTAEALQVIAEANAILKGTPTPLPWNAVLITPIPPPTITPLPTQTPIPLLISEALFTPTPTSTPGYTGPEQLPQAFRNKIIFLSDRSGKTETYLIDPNNGNLWLITQDWVYPRAQQLLTFSPDGKFQALVEEDQKQILQIKIYSYEYGSKQQVTAISGYAFAYDPAWSPTHPVVAYVSNESGGDEIYTVNIEDGSSHRLTDNSWEWDKHPSWSPDGREIVFYSNRESGRRQLWIMAADGSNPRNLSNNLHDDWDPIWLR